MKITQSLSAKKRQYVRSRLARKATLTPAELQRRLKARFGQVMRYDTLRQIIAQAAG